MQTIYIDGNFKLKTINKFRGICELTENPKLSMEKYNQQNIALRKIKINEVQQDMDNTIILIS